jgi:mannose-6-phosphate isomerase-like protein (cupin superfamily)
MPRYLRWFVVASLAVAGLLAAWFNLNGRRQIAVAHDVIHQATAAEVFAAQDDSTVIFLSAKQLDSEIHKVPETAPGSYLVDLVEYNPSKGGASVLRRTRPGHAEVHKRLTDMWYVVQGEGTLVTGGSLSESTETEADEFRGRGITGGEERHIGRGDFVRIPAGVPHWIRQIDGNEICYLVVKVTSK